MVVIVRLDLDKFSLSQLNDLIQDHIITISEACQAKSFTDLSPVLQLMQTRHWQGLIRSKKSA